MRRSRLLTALAVLPIAASALAFDQADQTCRNVDPDSTADTGDEYDLCEVAGFLREGTTKIGNLANVSGSPQAHATWGANAPDASVSDGAGGGYLASSPLSSNAGLGKMTLAGEFTGELDVIDLDLFLLYPQGDVFAPDDIKVAVTVDGQVVAGGADQFVVLARYLGGDTESLWKQEFAITGLRDSIGPSTPDEVHEIEITIQPHFSDSGNWTYVYDTTEVPAALTFNPVKVPAFVPALQAY